MDRIDSLKLFTLVAETESFTKAAEISRLPRSTVSAVIQKLEASHNVQLFYRTTRKVHLTQDGSELLERCRHLLAEMDDIDGLFKRNPGNISGRLKINVPSRIGSRVIAPALPDFFDQYPSIEIDMGSTDRNVDLIQEGIDCVLRVGSPIPSSLIAKPLGHFEIINCVSPDYLHHHGTPCKPEDLMHHWAVNFASPTTGKIDPWEYVKGEKFYTVSMKSRVIVNNADTYIACAIAGMGLIQIPAYDVQHHLAVGELVEVLPNVKAAPMPVQVMYPHRRHLSKRVRVFIEWIEKLIKAL